MVKGIQKLVKRYGYLTASLTAAALVLVANVGAGTFCWFASYQPEPPK